VTFHALRYNLLYIRDHMHCIAFKRNTTLVYLLYYTFWVLYA